jgi:hypothetical protein
MGQQFEVLTSLGDFVVLHRFGVKFKFFIGGATPLTNHLFFRARQVTFDLVRHFFDKRNSIIVSVEEVIIIMTRFNTINNWLFDLHGIVMDFLIHGQSALFNLLLHIHRGSNECAIVTGGVIVKVVHSRSI